MFRKVANNAVDNKPPTEFELERLRRSAFSANLSRLVLEVFATISDVAFTVILYDLALSISLDNSWYAVGVRACGNATQAESEYFASAFLQLAIVSTVLLFIRVSFRAFTAAWQVAKSRKRLHGPGAWLVASLGGCVVTILDPWSGSLLIESQFTLTTKRLRRDQDVRDVVGGNAEEEEEALLAKAALDDYHKMLQELRSDWTLLFLDTMPHFIIQVAYAAMASQNAHYSLSPAWYVATITTSIKMLSQLQEVLYLQWNYSTLRRMLMEHIHYDGPFMQPLSRRNKKQKEEEEAPPTTTPAQDKMMDLQRTHNTRAYDENL